MARHMTTTPVSANITHDTQQSLEAVNRAIRQEGLDNNYRTNLSFPMDGTEDFEAPLPLLQAATADLPDEAEWEGGMVYDSTTGAPVFSDGVSWLEVQVQDALLDDISDLADPNADRGLFWDDSAGFITWWSATAPLSFSGTTLIIAAASDSAVGVVEGATDAEVWAATADKFMDAALIESASAPVTLTDAATIALDWDAGVNRSVTLTAARAMGNPTNGQPGTWRSVRVAGNDATLRVLTFGSNYVGTDLTAIIDATSTKFWLVSIYCHTTSEFWVFPASSA